MNIFEIIKLLLKTHNISQCKNSRYKLPRYSSIKLHQNIFGLISMIMSYYIL